MELTKAFEEALVYALRLHETQRRKGSGVPYIAHLLAVASLVIEDGGDETQAIAALLHDAIEDQGGDTARQEIRRKFGEHVLAIVETCSESDTKPKPPWKERKDRLLRQMREASPEALRVAVADKLHNLRSIVADRERQGEDIWKRFSSGKDAQLWFYHSFTEIVRGRFESPMMTEIERLERILAD